MYNDTMTGEEKISLLKKREVKSGGDMISYGFYSLMLDNEREYYALEVASNDDAELAVIGKEHGDAKALFDKITDGAVTPLTLFDVICDTNMSKKY